MTTARVVTFDERQGLNRWIERLEETPSGPLAIGARLVPEAACRSVIASLSMDPCDPRAAAERAAFMVNLYPARGVPDAEIYIGGITSVLADCPADLVPGVIDRLNSILPVPANPRRGARGRRGRTHAPTRDHRHRAQAPGRA